MHTKEAIIRSTIPILASQGCAGTSMRNVAGAMGREPSIIYGHFADKQTLLRETRRFITTYLDEAQNYAEDLSAHQLLIETLAFQFEHREMIVALLQYFMAARDDFQSVQTGGYVPDRAYQHMTRVIEKGIAEGVYTSADVRQDAKATTHLINGYLMEYFDHEMSQAELDTVIAQLTSFIERALTAKASNA